AVGPPHDESCNPLEAPERPEMSQPLESARDRQFSVLIAAVQQVFGDSCGLGSRRSREDVPPNDELDVGQCLVPADRTGDDQPWESEDDAAKETTIECWITCRDCMDWIMWLGPETAMVELAFAGGGVSADDLPNEPAFIDCGDLIPMSSGALRFPWID